MDTNSFQASLRDQERIKHEAKRVTKYRASVPLNDQRLRYPGFHQGTKYYKEGKCLESAALPLRCDMVMHEGVAMILSDKTTIYCDIFLPGHFKDLDTYIEVADKVPSLIAWSPYGKQKGGQMLQDFPLRAGVPKSWVSGLQKWEGPDPAHWCGVGYAVVNVDTRGAYTSEGDCLILGHQEAQDGAEFITWVSEQSWCNGKVALTGNSWLAISQWKIGSLRPKGLAALAPWEGMDDLYREGVCKGGVQAPRFHDFIIDTIGCRNKVEDVSAFLDSQPLWHAYWEDKRARPERINVPVYAVASWTNPVHTSGTFRAWSKIPSEVPKWLRVHNAQEWVDYYSNNNRQDLQRFFDYYLKGRTENGWPNTPRVRLSILNFGLTNIPDWINRPEGEWPLSRTRYQRLYLGEDNSMSLAPPPGEENLIPYHATTGQVHFWYVFPESCETTGYFMAHLLVSCAGHTEMDLYVQVQNFGANGHRQGTLVIRPQSGVLCALLKFMHDWQIGVSKAGFLFHWGPNGVMRASHALDKDPSFTKAWQPYYTHTRSVPLTIGETRVVDIPMSPYGMFWNKGDILQFSIAGKPVNPFPLPGMEPLYNNKGTHLIHCGGRGEDSSYLLVPRV